MFALGQDLQYYLSIGSVCMCNGIDGLSGIIRNKLGRDPLSGEVFIFISKNKYNMKLLHWERGGFVLYQKRLERGTFKIPDYDITKASFKMEWHTLIMLIEGITLKQTHLRKRYVK